MGRLLFLIPILAFGTLMVVFAGGLTHDPSKLPSVLINRPLPAFALPRVRPADAGGLAAADMTGRPAMLNVFASWCVSCKLEHPMLLQLKSQGVPIQGIDWKDDPQSGAQYLMQNGDPYQKVGNDESGRSGIDLGVAGVPETFIVDRHGRVRYKQIGPISIDDWTRTLAPLMHQLSIEP